MAFSMLFAAVPRNVFCAMQPVRFSRSPPSATAWNLDRHRRPRYVVHDPQQKQELFELWPHSVIRGYIRVAIVTHTEAAMIKAAKS
jgi:hypothetical protein